MNQITSVPPCGPTKLEGGTHAGLSQIVHIGGLTVAKEAGYLIIDGRPAHAVLVRHTRAVQFSDVIHGLTACIIADETLVAPAQST